MWNEAKTSDLSTFCRRENSLERLFLQATLNMTMMMMIPVLVVEVMTPHYCRSFHLLHCRFNPGLVKIHLENIQSVSFFIWKCEHKGGGVSTEALERSPHSDKGCGKELKYCQFPSG